jgi:uncharacterized membrane protein HdeD (DUF308 family)
VTSRPAAAVTLRPDATMEIATEAIPPSALADAADDQHTEFWWIFLVGGVLWLVFALLVFQFDETSVSAVSILLGITCAGGAALELLAVPASHGWWRVARIALAVGFAIVATVAFVHPGDSFKALGTIFAFYLLIRGVFEVAAAFIVRGYESFWWLMLIAGSVQILLAFWAAGDFGHKSFLLIVWVGASALAHGFVEIVRAFELRPPH